MRLWTEKEIKFLKENYQTMATKEMALKLNRDFTTTKRAVKKHIYDVNCVNIPTGFVVIPESPIHAVNCSGQVIRIKTRKQIQPHPNKKGYPVVCLKDKKTKSIHRIVAECFLENPENKPQVNHLDGDKWNNHVSNLEWCTNKENFQHAIETGLLKDNGEKIRKHQTGETNSFAKLKKSDVLKIYDLLISGKGVCAIAKDFGVNHSQISVIKSGKSWKHLYHIFLQRSQVSRKDVGSSESKWEASCKDEDMIGS